MRRIAKGDPTVWKIVEGKLYLNCRQEIMIKWEHDIPGYIEKANKNWPGLLEETGKKLLKRRQFNELPRSKLGGIKMENTLFEPPHPIPLPLKGGEGISW